MSSSPVDAVTHPVAAVADALADIKPRLRGWLHTYAVFVFLAAGVSLIAVAGALHGARAGWPTAVYALTVTGLFGTSALYHRRSWSPAAKALMARADHSMIFVFIAGTYTPIAVLTLPHTTAIIVLSVVWGGALLGVSLKLAWITAPRWLTVPCYIALGWVAAFIVPDLLHHAGVAAVVLLFTGGAVYTLGALVYGFKRPNPFPRTFGFHEVFHACTLVAAISHYIAIWFCVL